MHACILCLSACMHCARPPLPCPGALLSPSRASSTPWLSSLSSPAVNKKTGGRLNGKGGSEAEVSDDTLDLTVIDRVQDYIKQISDITSKVPDQVCIIISIILIILYFYKNLYFRSRSL